MQKKQSVTDRRTDGRTDGPTDTVTYRSRARDKNDIEDQGDLFRRDLADHKFVIRDSFVRLSCPSLRHPRCCSRGQWVLGESDND